MTKDKLPDVGSQYEGAGGSVDDCVDFITHNFHEMTKLWLRMQSHTYSVDKEKREQERLDLRLLVGTNLVRLSSLEGVSVNLYSQVCTSFLNFHICSSHYYYFFLLNRVLSFLVLRIFSV